MTDYLRKLAQKLGTEGPIKTLSTPRAVKLLHNGQYFLTTTNARYVWEIPPYPQFYVPATELRAEAEKAGSCLEIKEGEEFFSPDSENAASSSEAQAKKEPLAKQWILTINNSEEPKKTIDQVIAFSPSLSSSSQSTAKDLAGLVKIEFSSIDQWFEEDTPIFVHPKDPFKRIDILTSHRPIKVYVSGVNGKRICIAYTPSAHHLYETGLPCRFYMPLTAVLASVLKPSERRTRCPYKGEAEYYSVELPGGKVYEDVVWFYNRPTVECAGIMGEVCFFNEKVDIELDGKMLERPDTHFGRFKLGTKPSAV
ncbi:hypothetical protein D0862_07780 [Hortaea werneckii]|uniref:DUF427 domain-containing protein n=1 Tax=Hortaea werneckii TaxID=91943 RepID=A0A3M7GA25_HORWE|nr:hypothetical protein D0862_07780 [Hortaea werneckii]